MGFVKRDFHLDEGVKVLNFLVTNLGIRLRDAKRMIDRGRVAINGERLYLKGYKTEKESILTCLVFEANGIGIKPFFENEDFAVFDKPSGVVIHPQGLNSCQTLLDDVRNLYGNDANLVHRIDKETSGIVIASKNKYSEHILKRMFEDRLVSKSYLALVEGIIDKKIVIDKPIATNKNQDIKVKSIISEDGKESITEIEPIKTFGDKTLVKATPITGRTHQIRVHLFSIGHRIVGDPIYGVDFDVADRYLSNNLETEERILKTGADRLALHAFKIEFSYRNRKYVLKKDIDFYNILKY